MQTYEEMQPLRAIGDPDCDAVLAVLDPQPDDDILQMLLDRVGGAGNTRVFCANASPPGRETRKVNWREHGIAGVIVR